MKLDDGHEQTPMCPFSIKQTEGSSLIGGEAPAVTAAPCFGAACMAYTQITDAQGHVVGGDCRLCLAPTTLNGIAAQLAALRAALTPAGPAKENLDV